MPETPFERQLHPDFPALNSRAHDALIGGSRERSESFGLQEHDRPDFSPLEAADLQSMLEENRFLYQHAAPVMETLYHQIANTQSMVLLTARSGLVLHSLGDSEFLEKAAQVALRPGVDWSERSKGTNAIGTALVEGHPVVVHGEQHFLQANRFLTCSCTPIFDPYGKVMGALDVTGERHSYHQHTMALARMSAQMIENHMFSGVFAKEVIVRFHSRSEFLGTLVEGIAVFSPDGRFITANRSALFQLELPLQSLALQTFSSLFGISIAQLHDRLRAAIGRPISLCLHHGVTVCVVSSVPRRSFEGMDFGAAQAQEKSPPDGPSPAPHKEFLSGLRYLDTGDAAVHAVIEKLYRVRGRDIPIMILGETGSGKDLLAQAIHHDSPRAQQKFVSVNCASIPESLIESELFGYDEGAFTGARRKGSVGKIMYANGGTLFLDEIGDMPKHLQARLLRVLQERKVSPLGAGREVEVDIAVICATNRNLREMIAKGEFREDLYYRLNGLVLRLPALRQRSDLEVVIRKILASVCHSAKPPEIHPEVLHCFRHYAWPGNFRQLFNLLRTAVVMADCSGQIGWEHLPDDFVEELRQHSAAAGSASAALSQAAVAEAFLPTLEPLKPMQGNFDSALSSAMSSAGSAPPAAKLVAAPVTAAGEPARLENLALEAMAQALRSTGGNVSEAAKLLGVSRNTLYRKKALLPPDVWG